MLLSSVQFWERIHSAGLATQEDCRNWATEISKVAPPESLRDATKLAAELIRLGKLTSFQANVLFSNLAIPIAIGPFRITESLESKLGPNWLLATDSTRTKRNSRWCYLLTPQNMMRPEVQGWPPSVELGEKQVGVSHPSLDTWYCSGVDKSNFVAFCDALVGQSLTALLMNRALTWSESAIMVEQIAAGLQKMHDVGISHGCICTDAIWCGNDGEFVLRRDPVFPPANPYSQNSYSILTSSRDVSLSVAAPELTLSNATPSFQSDLYALGCVWYLSLTRSSPYGDGKRDTPHLWSKAHTAQPANPLSPAQLPLPFQPCLDHLLAKNPSARFAFASELMKAIELAVIQSDMQPVQTKVQEMLPVEVVVKAPAEDFIRAELATPLEKASEAVIKKKASVAVPLEPKIALPVPVSAPVYASVPSPALDTKPVKPATKVPKSSKKKPRDAKAGGKKKSKKKKKPFWLMPAMLGGACLIFGVMIAILVRNNGTPVAVVPNPPPVPAIPLETTKAVGSNESFGSSSNGKSEPVAKKPADSVGEIFAVETDDGQLLWAPPEAGSPYSLEMFPAGMEALVFVSGNLWHHRGVASGIGKWWSGAQPELAKLLSGLPLLDDDRIQSVGIALFPSKTPGVPQALFRITFSQPVSIESVTQRATGFSLQVFDPKSTPKKGLWSNDAPSNPTGIMMEGMQTESASMIKRAVVGPQELLVTLTELNGGTAPLRRQMESLLKTTDSRSDLTVLFAPSFLYGDGREVFGSMPKIQAILRETIDESMQAVAMTTTFEPRWYTEVRMLSSETKDAGRFAASLKAKLLGIPDEFEKGLASGVGLHPYWRALGLRYPQMMRALNRFGRFGLEDGQVVVNSYLPTDAISNVAISSWMTLQTTSFEATAAVVSAPKPTSKPQSKSIDAILESKITIGFDQESLEAALQLISSEVVESVLAGSKFSMAINGNAFQKEGITRNQQVRAFQQKEIPLRQVLTDLVRRANPVTTVQSPTEVNQKVVWLVLDDAERPGQKKIELTTRTWAETNKVALPKEFIAQ